MNWLHELHLDAFLFFRFSGYGASARFHRTGNEFGNVERLHESVVETGILLRQQERLARFAIGTDVGNIRACVQSVYPAAAEDEPAAVAAP